MNVYIINVWGYTEIFPHIFELPPPPPPTSDLSVLFSPLCVCPNVIIKFDDMLYASIENFTVMPTPHI